MVWTGQLSAASGVDSPQGGNIPQGWGQSSGVGTVLRGGDSPQGSGESSGVGTVIRHGDWSEVRKVNSYIWGVSSGVGTVVNHAEDCGKR